MPRPDTITIHTQDLKEIIDRLAAQKFSGGVVRLVVDAAGVIWIRDYDHSLIDLVESKLKNPNS